jgi:hypothetical protein
MRIGLVTAFVLAASLGANAEQTSATLNGKNISINYAGSAMKGRKVFGASVPYNQVWKIGETSAPTFHTDADLVFKGAVVPKGDYSLYVLVAADKWVLIINKQTGSKPYNAKMDLGRINMTLAKAPAPAEVCRVTLTKSAALAAKLEIAWEDTVARTQFHLDRVAGDSEW